MTGFQCTRSFPVDLAVDSSDSAESHLIGGASRRSLKTIPCWNRDSDVYPMRLSMLSCLGIRRIWVTKATRGQAVVANTCRYWATRVVHVAASQVRVGGISLCPSE